MWPQGPYVYTDKYHLNVIMEDKIWLFIAVALLMLAGIGALAYWADRRERRKEAATGKVTPSKEVDDECCGAHAVCERDSLLTKSLQVEYYDDEELDELAGINVESYTPQQIEQLEHVFYTLKEKDVAGWLRSLQARNIQLPDALREEALLIVSERRKA